MTEQDFVCRSATFDTVNLKCYLSRYTLRTNPMDAEADPDYDYLENECNLGKQSVFM